jgi:polyhydroxybutyrate depolymerase
MSLLLPFAGCGTDAAGSGETPDPVDAATAPTSPATTLPGMVSSETGGAPGGVVPPGTELAAPGTVVPSTVVTDTVVPNAAVSASSTANGPGDGLAGAGGQATSGPQSTGTVPSASSSGGGPSTGGSTGAEGGGLNAGGAATGGNDPGVGASGGTAGAAGGGVAAGGTTGIEGAGSPGCGAANPLQSNTVTVDIDGTSRTYVLDVPTDYDTNTQYKLVFVWHPLGGSASQVVNGGYNGLKSLANGTTIFVAPDGLDGSNEMVSGKGWWNQGDGDMKLLTAMLDEFNANLCIDQERIFSTGFSFGGMMSYTVGYEFDVFRAIAPCSGNLTVIPHEPTFMGPLAIMAFHGDNDTFVTTAGGKDALDQYVSRNNCLGETQPTDPSPCVEYQGCDQPTIWCEFPGGHEPWSQQPQAIWAFFSQF